MPLEAREVRLSSKPRHVVTADGALLAVPPGWALLEPGDPALSRRIKQDGPTWAVIEVKGRKRFSHGIWAPAERITALRAALLVERQDPAYARKLAAGRQRRAAAQEEYVEDFRGAVCAFLAFHPRYCAEAEKLADLITAHAVPVGSGTVARTQRIPIEQRAAAATIAWMRHATTGYDNMVIPRERGRRREVRRLLAQRSGDLLSRYRRGEVINVDRCPLQHALRARPPAADFRARPDRSVSASPQPTSLAATPALVNLT